MTNTELNRMLDRHLFFLRQEMLNKLEYAKEKSLTYKWYSQCLDEDMAESHALIRHHYSYLKSISIVEYRKLLDELFDYTFALRDKANDELKWEGE